MGIMAGIIVALIVVILIYVYHGRIFFNWILTLRKNQIIVSILGIVMFVGAFVFVPLSLSSPNASKAREVIGGIFALIVVVGVYIYYGRIIFNWIRTLIGIRKIRKYQRRSNNSHN